MKKIALVIATLAFATGTAMACPHGDKAEHTEAAPKTAEKAKTGDKAKATPTKEAEKPAPTKTAKPADKQAEKVSSK
ncbi:MAG: hypothetical protein M3680_25825 [Myxococcota bacterium]|nr:hypothetical protein [Myxococcota bacterium]